jgi:hypothetical protein
MSGVSGQIVLMLGQGAEKHDHVAVLSGEQINQ